MPQVKVLCIAPYPVEGASARLRVLQFFPSLRAMGLEMCYRPFMDSQFFKRFYEPGHILRKTLRLSGMTLRRFADIKRSRAFDVVLIHREAVFFGPPLVEKLIARYAGKPVVFDFDDAIHVSYVSPTYGKLATLIKYPQKTPQIIAFSRAVIAGNHHLQEYARGINPAVTLIPTVVDANIVKPAPKSGGPTVLGWIGTHSTYPYLAAIFPVLQQLARRHDFVLRVIGAGRDVQLEGVNVDNRRWGLETEVGDLQSLDIGLYPLPEDEWAVGKSGFKAVQYMAVGIPAVCSPVGATRDLITDGVHGFLPATPIEWQNCLESLLTDAELCRSMGNEGRARVQEWYCLEKQAPRLRNVLEGAAS